MESIAIATFKDSIEIHNISKWEDPIDFRKTQNAIANAFGLLDVEDVFDNIYSYIVSKDNKNNEIVSGYRYILCKNSRNGNSFNLNTYKYYEFSDEFSQNYADFTLELGRSFVNPEAQKKLWGLVSIWKCGLGPLINYQSKHNGIQYILGQVSLKENVYDLESIKAILKMFWVNFGTTKLLFPREPVFSKNDLETFEGPSFINDYKQNKVTLTKFLKEKNQPKPTLFFSYADLVEGKRSGLSCFLPVYNPLLKCYEMGFLLKISEISPENQEKYLQSSYKPNAFE